MNELCRKARNPPTARIHGWIVGKSMSAVCPTILIICRDSHYCKVAKHLIRDSGLVDLLMEDKIFFKVTALPNLISRPAGTWDNRGGLIFSSGDREFHCRPTN